MKYGYMGKSKQLGFLALVAIILSFVVIGETFAVTDTVLKGPVNIEADRLSYDKEQDTYHAEGDVIINFSGGTLKADSVDLHRATSDAAAKGHVSIKSGEDYLEGERLIFDFARKTGVVYEGKMFIAGNHLYLRGTKIEKKGEATYYIENATASTCDGDNPDWRLASREMNVTIDGYGTLNDGKFFAKDIPILYIPYLLFPAKKTRQTGFLFPNVAYSTNKNGLDIEVPFFWAISQNTDATFFQRYMGNRGFKEGMEFRYVINKDSFGTFYGDYLDDQKNISETTDGLSRNWQSQKRWSYYLNHETKFDKEWYFRADIWRVSDIWYFKDFSSHNYYLAHHTTSESDRFNNVPVLANSSLPFLDSKLRLVKNWQLSNLTILGQYTDDLASMSNDATLQKYPEVTWTVIDHPLFGSPLHASLSTSYDYYYREEGQKGHLFDVNPLFSLPVKLIETLQFTPFIGLQETLWEREDRLTGDADRNGSRGLYRAGANLSMELHRIFDVNGTTVEKIRHEIKPELIYTYVPRVDQSDMPDFVTGVDEKSALTYALTNTMIARLKNKDGKISYREILRFKLSQTYNIKETTEDWVAADGKKRHFSDIDMELDVLPLKHCTFKLQNRYDVNTGEWKQTNYNLHLTDTRGDAAILEYRYTQDAIEEININLRALINKAVDVTYTLRKNMLDDRTIENTYSLHLHRQCWNIELSYSDSQSDRTLMLGISLLGFSNIGREDQTFSRLLAQ